jgi:hypothetical protein
LIALAPLSNLGVMMDKTIMTRLHGTLERKTVISTIMHLIFCLTQHTTPNIMFKNDLEIIVHNPLHLLYVLTSSFPMIQASLYLVLETSDIVMVLDRR